jgi:hypothetical protein
MNLRAAFLLCLSFGFVSEAFSEYVRVGPLFGQDCMGLGIEVCPEYELYAAKKGDQYHSLKEVVSDSAVTSYRESNNMCFKTLRSTGGGLLSGAINLVFLKTYAYYDENGRLQDFEPDYLRFKCYRR